MRVKRNFDDVYDSEEDPWAIGDADSDRYNLYVEAILEASRLRGSFLDIGCGFGALLARFEGEFERLVGVEISARAIERGRERFPFIEFHQGSADALEQALPGVQTFDTILFSDVVCYLPEAKKRRAVQWIADHLSDGGLAFIAGWSPGGRYLDQAEMRNLVERSFAIEEERLLETGHVWFACRKRRRVIALTIDYETWQPVPADRTIDWQRDVFEPADRLMDTADSLGVPITFMAEMGEYYWLEENDPDAAAHMRNQWRDAVRRGHDVQLHLHPNWLPELGARHENGTWYWNDEYILASDFPGDLGALIARCRKTLEDVLRTADEDYAVSAFRAGTYQAQPFPRLHDALAANGIGCDSSVLPGDRRDDRHYDYRHAYSSHQPYFASRQDPQLKAPPSEQALIEFPVFSIAPGQRWTFDNNEGARFADRLIKHCDGAEKRPSSDRIRRRRQVKSLLNYAYWRGRRARGTINRVLPETAAAFLTDYAPERLTQSDFYVMVAHTKADLDSSVIAAGLRRLKADGRFEFLTLSECARLARDELEQSVARDRNEEASRQVEREYTAMMSDDRNVAQSELLQGMLPLDRTRVLDVGCGTGHWSAALATTYDWLEVVGVDAGEDFVARAAERYASERVSFKVADFADLPFTDGSFDCLYADNTLEHAFDVDLTLRELWRVLMDGGVLLAAIPPDALNPQRVCDNHTWKTWPPDVKARLLEAGFSDVEIREVDIFRDLGMAPYPPSRNRMMYIRAWKRDRPASHADRVRALCSWAYHSLDPSRSQTSDEPLEILREGYAWCWGYVVTLAAALQREDFTVRWVTMTSDRHPRAIEAGRTESHEVLEVRAPDGEVVVADPMANVVFNASIDELLTRPALADVPREPDGRWTERRYALYASSQWYEAVDKVAIRDSLAAPLRLVPVPQRPVSATA